MLSTEHRLRSWDGTELFYRAWLPAKPASKALLLFHRGHEHSARWSQTVRGLDLKDVAVFAWDARGHGRSSGERGRAESLATLVKDADAFMRHVCAAHSVTPQDTVLVAHSVGAVIAAAWVHDYAPPIRGLILGAPAFRVKLYIPFALPLLRLRQRLFGPGYVKSFVRGSMLTHDPEEAVRYDGDELIFRQIAVNILIDLHDTSTRLLNDAGAITVPTLLLAAGSDWVVRKNAQEKFFDGLSSPLKRMEVLPGMYHDIFHEKGRQLVVAKVREFVHDCFRRPQESGSLLQADKQGHTKKEYDRLTLPDGLRWGVAKLALKTVGRLSKGVQLGWRSGFDSGLTLDYVYENRPQGISPLGQLIDHSYLNSIGWRGIRMRRNNIKKLLRETIEKTQSDGRPVRLLDIASGPGRYVLETVRELAHIPVDVLLRDYNPENLNAALRITELLRLKNIALAQGDAFDRASLARVRPRPTIAVVSGLYELFPANEPVLESLRGLAEAIEPGGYLVYTNQPWHPQVEFIARVLINREGRPWIMRRRTQAEMDELVGTAGFEKIRQEVDPWGIFTVSLARRSEG